MLVSKEQYNKNLPQIFNHMAKNCVFFGDFTSTSGKPMTRIFLLRRMLLNSSLMEYVGECMLHKIEQRIGNFHFQLSGPESGSIPLMLGISYAAKKYGINLNVIYTRKKRKPYGTRHIIEGVPNNLPILLCDDLINSGSSLKKCKAALQEDGLQNIILPFQAAPLCNKPKDSYIFLFTWDQFTKSKIRNPHITSKNTITSQQKRS